LPHTYFEEAIKYTSQYEYFIQEYYNNLVRGVPNDQILNLFNKFAENSNYNKITKGTFEVNMKLYCTLGKARPRLWKLRPQYVKKFANVVDNDDDAINEEDSKVAKEQFEIETPKQEAEDIPVRGEISLVNEPSLNDIYDLFVQEHKEDLIQGLTFKDLKLGLTSFAESHGLEPSYIIKLGALKAYFRQEGIKWYMKNE
jgi:hypothetical protein